MQLIKEVEKMRKKMLYLRQRGEKIGFVPTMGYLHEGHLTLMRKARGECSTVVISIFVNPIQFGPSEDLERYPRNLKRDRLLAESQGVDYIFNPEAEEMYGEGFNTSVSVRDLNKIMCGKYRPAHFDGVCTVVLKLFNIICPHISYFGEKDFQQLVIIKKMVGDLNLPVEIVGCPVVRESDGLAMSSRNKYLSAQERVEATVLYRCLELAAEMIKNGQKDTVEIKKHVMDIFSETNLLKKVDYFDFRDPQDLKEIRDISKFLKERPDRELLIASAIWIGKTRLIDNIIVKPVPAAGELLVREE